jgi:antitoxin ParD1/3/4
LAYYANDDFEDRAMPTRNVVLTDHQAELVERLVATGRYQNASEVLREGIRLVEQREAENKVRLDELRSAIRAGEADVAAGRTREFGEPAALRRHLMSVGRAAIAEGTRRKRQKK